ncbi:MAG: hypothetical protein ACRDOE_22355, partial [Streptosporangiaceae bacterium]
MTATGRRDVSDAPAAEAIEQLAELGRLVLYLGRRAGLVACTAAVKVKSKEAAGGRAVVVDGDGGRLSRKVGGELPGVPGRVSAAAIARDSDVRRARDQGRDCQPCRP